jgi:hypothetical protein
MGVTKSYTGANLNADNAAIPCGLIAKSIFNGFFYLSEKSF